MARAAFFVCLAALLIAGSRVDASSMSWRKAERYFEAYVSEPYDTTSKHFTAGYRGLLHALRDVLFPEFRNGTEPISHTPETEVAADGAVKPQPRSGYFDRGFDGETEEDKSLRLRHRDWWLDLADRWGLPELNKTHPDGLRYGMAVCVGLVLLGILNLVRACTACCARVCLRSLFKLTGNDAFNDEDDPNAIDAQDGSGRWNNVFNRMFQGEVEYAFDPRLSQAQREAIQKESDEAKERRALARQNEREEEWGEKVEYGRISENAVKAGTAGSNSNNNSGSREEKKHK